MPIGYSEDSPEYTGRRLTLAFNAAYHGSVDETSCRFLRQPHELPGLMGPLVEDF